MNKLFELSEERSAEIQKRLEKSYRAICLFVENEVFYEKPEKDYDPDDFFVSMSALFCVIDRILLTKLSQFKAPPEEKDKMIEMIYGEAMAATKRKLRDFSRLQKTNGTH